MSEYKSEIDNMSQAGWGSVLSRFDDSNIHQTFEYGERNWGRKNLSHFVFKYKGQIISAAQLWVVRFPILNAGLAYIPWGPVWRLRDLPIQVRHFKALIKALHQEYVVKRGLLLRIRFNEIDTENNYDVKQALDEMQNAGIISLTNEYRYRTIIVNLNHSLEQLRINLRKSWRRQLKKAEKNNLQISVGTSNEEFAIFCELYQDMISRKKFTKNIIDPYLYADIQKTLPELNKMRIILSRFDGHYVSGSILSAQGNTGKSLLAATGTLDIEQKLSSSYLMDWHSMEWLKHNGFKYLDLRGYNPNRYPGYSHYKAGFGGDDVRFVGTYEACQNIISKKIVQFGHKIESNKDKIIAESLKIRNKILNPLNMVF
jgi:lipid II:glycine glycyltransferase (peptidoglycan interpeptide bridge formation enzyme)